MISDKLKERIARDKYFLPALVTSIFVLGIILGYVLAYSLILENCVDVLGINNLTCITRSQADGILNYSKYPLDKAVLLNMT